MRVIVITPPEAVVSAADARAVGLFADAADDLVDTLLDVAQAQIDGPDGWLGRAIGLQTLEADYPAGCVIDPQRLPLPPYVNTISDTLASDGQTRTIRWRAGYGDQNAMKPLPAPIRHAIIMMAATLHDAVPETEGTLKRVTVDGIGTHDYSVPTKAADAMKNAAAMLLQPYRVLSL